jgi:hypothetical protein
MENVEIASRSLVIGDEGTAWETRGRYVKIAGGHGVQRRGSILDPKGTRFYDVPVRTVRLMTEEEVASFSPPGGKW